MDNSFEMLTNLSSTFILDNISIRWCHSIFSLTFNLILNIKQTILVETGSC